MKSLAVALALSLFAATAAAQTCTLPYTLTNGTTTDATQVMSNFSALASCINSNGLVNSGTSGQVGYYASTASVISGESLSNLFDSAIGSTQGNILYRGGSGWAVLPPGTSGQVLTTGGAGANPAWGTGVTSGLSRLYSTGAAIGNGNDTTEDTLQTYSLPGGTLAASGQVVRITAAGTLAANTHNKTIRVYFGTDVVTMTSSTASSVNWRVTREIMKNGSNSQVISSTLWLGATSGNEATLLNLHSNPTMTDTSPIVFKITGQISGTTAANDIVCDFFLVEFLS